MTPNHHADDSTEGDLRAQLCTIGKRLWERRLIAANDGNISVRLKDNRILCSPSGISKGFMQPGDLVITDEQGTRLQGKGQPSSELKMHLEIFRRRSDVNAVIHAHPPYATAFAVAGLSVPQGVMPEIDVLLGRVPLVAYETPGSMDLAMAVGLATAGVGGEGANAVLMTSHGATTCGLSVEEAWLRMESLEQSCQTLLLARAAGGWREIPTDKRQELERLRGQTV